MIIWAIIHLSHIKQYTCSRVLMVWVRLAEKENGGFPIRPDTEVVVSVSCWRPPPPFRHPPPVAWHLLCSSVWPAVTSLDKLWQAKANLNQWPEWKHLGVHVKKRPRFLTWLNGEGLRSFSGPLSVFHQLDNETPCCIVFVMMRTKAGKGPLHVHKKMKGETKKMKNPIYFLVYSGVYLLGLMGCCR